VFRQLFEHQTTEEAAGMLRLLFNQVETLLRILLVIPADSCKAERSFSGLRHLKTWLRSSMSQKRINAVAVCHAHQKHIDIFRLVNEFVSNNERRQSVFGKF